MVRDPARLIACKTAMQRLIDRIGTPFSIADLHAFKVSRTVTISAEVKKSRM
jgi:hypothetical protein